jgi:Mg/Co/Ni transporter MgtE
LQKLPCIGTSPSDFDDKLIKALHEEEYVQCLAKLEGDDLTWLVEYLDKVRSRELPPSLTQASVGSRWP